MVLYAAWSATNPQERNRTYTTIISSDVTLDNLWGPSANPFQQESNHSPNSVTEATEGFVSKYREKVHGGNYVVSKSGLFEGPPMSPASAARYFTSDATSVELFDVIRASSIFLSRIRSQADVEASREAEAKVEETIVKVDDRAAAMMPPAGEVFTRPNGEVYHPRYLDRHTDVMVLRAFRSMPNPINVLLMGPAGSGKTALAEVAHGDDLITINGHGDMTVAHLVGSLMPTAEGGWRFEAGPLTIAMSEGKALLIDEINKLPNEIMSIFHSVTDGRGVLRIDDRPDNPLVQAKPGFCLIGTLNPDQLGSNMLPEALTSRFPVPIVVTTDLEAAESMGVDSRFITVAANLATRNQKNPEAPPVWVPQMRELLATKRLMDAGMGASFAAAALLGQCPRPEDTPLVADALQQVFGVPVSTLELGAQI